MILELRNVSKGFPGVSGEATLSILKGVDLQIHPGEIAAIIGPSGCGKSTLLSLIAGLDRPDEGQILLEGQDLAAIPERELTRYRAAKVSIVFQQFHLMPHLTALENVALPLELASAPRVKERAMEALVKVGIKDRSSHFPRQMSGGECQRVAIARALVVEPSLLLADEPTGNLDERTSVQVSDCLFDLVHSHAMTLLLVTHDRSLASRCHRTLTLMNGGIS